MTSTFTNAAGAFFTYQLSLKLTLTADGPSVQIPSGNIESVSLDLHSYGFTGSIQFSNFGDADLSDFFSFANAPKETTVDLVFKNTENPDNSPPWLELSGIATKKFLKRVDQIGQQSSVVYHYEIMFSDTAHVKLSQHFPTNIYINESMKHALDQNMCPGVSVDYQFSPLDQQEPILAFSLPFNPYLPADQQCSFYSFLTWYLQQENGIWMYDYAGQRYVISNQKNSEGTPYKIHEKYVIPPTYSLPDAVRYNIKTIQHSSNIVDITDIATPHSFEAVRRDILAPLSMIDFLDETYKEVQSPPNAAFGAVRLHISQFSSDFQLDKLTPGSLVSFQENNDHNTWPSDSFYSGKTFRVTNLRLEAYKLELSEAPPSDLEPYRLSVTALLEQKDEPFVARPSFLPPSFPFSIHGEIFSDIGLPLQSTFSISQQVEGLEVPFYTVYVPLAGEEKFLIVPFIPAALTGQFYFPFCKGESVVLSVHFKNAQIERVINWQPLARLPANVQGNQILFASSGKDQYSVLKHEFEDLQNSVLLIKQMSSETLSQTIKIAEKTIDISVQEKNKVTIAVNINLDLHLNLSFHNEETGVTQDIVMDGKTITHTCKNKSATSSYVQKPGSISVTCNEFTVNAGKINLNAKDTISQKADNKVNIEAPVTAVKSPSVKLGP